MGISNWLADQAEQEKNNRLYGGKPPRGGVWRALGTALIWSIGIVIALSAAAGLAGLLLTRYGSNEYVLVCEGAISAQDRDDVGATMYVEMREYGRIIQLWSKDAGTVRLEIPSTFYGAAVLRPAGSLTSISTYAGLPGHYSSLSGAVTMRLDRGREFQGKCVRRS